MKKKFKLGVIGCGYMATAALRGAVLSDYLPGKKIVVSDIIEEKTDSINEELGVFTCNSNKFVAENSEFLLLAVTPRHFHNVVKSLGGVIPEKVISIMAGVSKTAIKSAFGSYDIKVARCMPNLPCSVGSGAIGIDMSDFNSDQDDIEFINNVFDSMGRVLSISEDKIDAVTGVSGSGPAYVFMFIDALTDAGVRQGLTKDEAKLLAVQTVIGSAEMVQREDEALPDLIMRVCSKGGATIEAVKVLEDRNFRSAVSDAVDACVKKVKELSES